MTAAELLAKARSLLDSDQVKPLIGVGVAAFEALELAANGDGNALADVLELLDAVTPRPFTFLLWADSAGAAADGDQVGLVYRYDRKKSEVLALMGKACLKAVRTQTRRRGHEADGWGEGNWKPGTHPEDLLPRKGDPGDRDPGDRP